MAAPHSTIDREAPGTRQGLWFGALGAGCGWLLHLIGAYLIAEFGCVGRLRSVSFLGLTAVAWLLLALSVVALLIAVAGTLTALRRRRAAAHGADDEPGRDAVPAAVDRTAAITGGLFVLAIIVESIPIFYYLRDC